MFKRITDNNQQIILLEVKEMKNYPPKNVKHPTQAALNIISSEPSETDPQGMYTGVTADGSEPIQDADDL